MRALALLLLVPLTVLAQTDRAPTWVASGPTSEFFSRLNGEFAFIIWDPRHKQIIAARDRFGIKPLYWYYDNSRLTFASEIKAIASVSGVTRKFSTGKSHAT